MATTVFFHAHPDDEAIATAGVMVQAAANGHRVVLICATDGSLGEAPDDAVSPGSTLADVRAAELGEAAAALGVHRVEFLGYRDSGMESEPSNHDPGCFWQADLEEAAARLAEILRAESAQLLTVYDSHGNYGHPDHIQVHRVGVRAAEMAAVPHVFEATMNRDRMRALADMAFEGDDHDPDLAAQREEMRETEMGTPAAEITHAVDVSAQIPLKQKALAAHRSQIPEDSFFMTMPDEAFAAAFGTEWFIERGSDRIGEPFLGDIFAGLTDRQE
jgi:LmbE family N-acetylglucosaminyl deacetylase